LQGFLHSSGVCLAVGSENLVLLWSLPGLFPGRFRAANREQICGQCRLLLSKSFTNNVTALTGERQLHYVAERFKKKSVLMQEGILIDNIYPLRTCA